MDALKKRRWLALYVLCFGELMIVLDTTIVNVALPSIREDLGFSETSLVWVVNAYMLTYGGFLLLGGRLGDLYGNRKMFLAGLAAFVAASLACGLSPSPAFLVAARAIQGLGGAVVSAIALALIMNIFTDDADRAKAMGVYGFICAAGGSIGVLLGGLLTSGFSWHWVFLVNVPLGAAVYAMSARLLPKAEERRQDAPLDVAGAVTITTSLMLAVYAIVDGNQAGWRSAQTLSLLGAAAFLFALFLVLEVRSRNPLIPLRIFKLRNVSISNVAGAFWAVGMFAWFFLSALYMQLVLGYTPMQIGLAFLPSNIIMAILSLGVSAWLVTRFGIKWPLVSGLFLAAAGLGLFALAPVDGRFMIHVLPGMLLVGLGCGIALNPILLAAMSDLPTSESGLASGAVNTSFMMGGALGLAVLASLAGARTEAAAATVSTAQALTSGYQAAFAVGALFAAVGSALSLFLVERLSMRGGAVRLEDGSPSIP